MPVTHEIETRGTLRATEVRASKAAGKFELTGRCASYNVPTKINDRSGAFLEQVAPGAFSRSLREGADVKATFNHDPNRILGRTKSGTLKLTDSKEGLLFRCILDPANTDHQNVHASVSRGDHSECSFAFKVPPGGDSWDTTTDPDTGTAIPRRTLKDVDLIDVAPAVTFPAYGGSATQVSARAAAHEAATNRPSDAVLLAASDAARRSAAVVAGRKIAHQTDASLRDRAARLGEQIRADAVADAACAAQEKRDDALRDRMENAAGRVFSRSKADENLDYPYESASSGAPNTYPYKELASAVSSQLGHSLVGANGSQAFTKDKDGTPYTYSYACDENGSHTFGRQQLGGHPAWLKTPNLKEKDV